MKKKAVIFYSRTGKTRLAAQAIGDTLKVKALEIKEVADYSGPIGFICGGKSALMKKTGPLSLSPNIENAELIVLGTPVWASTLPPATLEWINNTDFHNKELILFSTYRGNPGKTLKQLEDILASKGGKILASFSIKTGFTKDEKIHKNAVDALIRLEALLN